CCSAESMTTPSTSHKTPLFSIARGPESRGLSVTCIELCAFPAWHHGFALEGFTIRPVQVLLRVAGLLLDPDQVSCPEKERAGQVRVRDGAADGCRDARGSQGVLALTEHVNYFVVVRAPSRRWYKVIRVVPKALTVIPPSL